MNCDKCEGKAGCPGWEYPEETGEWSDQERGRGWKAVFAVGPTGPMPADYLEEVQGIIDSALKMIMEMVWSEREAARERREKIN